MANSIEGKVIEVSESGDLITDIESSRIGQIPRDSGTKITVDDEHETFGLFEVDHDQPTMTLIAIVGDGPLKLSLVGDSARMMLGVSAGARVVVAW